MQPVLILSKKGVIYLMAGMTLIGIVLFIMGMMIGASMNQVAESQPIATPVEPAEEAVVEENQTPETPANSPEASASQAPADTTGYTIQLGAFIRSNNADRMIKMINDKGYAAYLYAAKDDKNRQWYKVRVGNYSDFASARRIAAQLMAQENLKSIVKRAGKL